VFAEIRYCCFWSSSSVEDGNEFMTIGAAGPFFSGFGEDLLVMIWRDVQG